MPSVTGGWSFDTVPGLAKVANEIARQSAMLGYLDAFMMDTAASGLAIALLLMVRRRKPASYDGQPRLRQKSETTPGRSRAH
jgi:MFS transporter, DHA2 family, multidrug resistance protein